MTTRVSTLAAGIALAVLLASCGGGGSSSSSSSGTATPSGANPGAFSSGAITAFGSVFVNGLEYSTTKATIVDDDTGAARTSTTGLEVGQVVDVDPAADSNSTTPVASRLHIHPLARGFIDAVDSSNSLLTVMGQSVQVDASTNFSDHRACVSAASAPCTAITGLSGLTATTGSGASAVAGNYLSVDGYLFGSGATTATTNIVATLVAIADAPTTGYGAAYKAEGLVSAVGTGTLSIGALTVDLSAATCHATGGTSTTCASAFAVGDVVSAFAKTAPALPATTFSADAVVLRPAKLVSTAGTTVEVEGSVSSVTTAPAGFVLRGVTIDASSLPAGTTLPAVGDIVRVLGTVETSGAAVSATSVVVLRHAQSATYGFEGDVSAVAAPASGSFTVTVLGKTLTVSAASRLADQSSGHWFDHDQASNPFNITTFQTYLAASASQHVLAQTYLDSSGNLQVISLVIVPASGVAAVAGVVDASPAPTNSTATGTPSTFAIQGVAVSADPAAIRAGHGQGTVTIAAGDEVTAFGTWSATALVVGATPSRGNVVVDAGPPRTHGHEGF